MYLQQNYEGENSYFLRENDLSYTENKESTSNFLNNAHTYVKICVFAYPPLYETNQCCQNGFLIDTENW